MQILLTHGEVGQAVIDYIKERVSVAADETVHVYLTEDGASIQILPVGVSPEGNEDEAGAQPSTGGESRPRKTRRTKAQIEADNLAEAERLTKAQENEASGNDAASTEASGAATPVAETEVAGETTQEVSGHGDEPEPSVDPQPEVDAPVVVEPEAEVEEQAEVQTEAEAATEAPKQTVSLFANLRKPKN